MSWVSLGDALETALAKALEVDGDAGVGAPAVSRKKTASAKPAAKSKEAPSANEGHTDRCMTVAPQSGLPHPAAVIHLRVIEGGRTEVGGNTPVRPMLKPYRGGGRANWLKLVSG